MGRLINAYNAIPNDLQPGDEMLFVVKCMIFSTGYRVYRCYWDGDEFDIPQGERLLPEAEREVIKAIFPVVEISEFGQDF